MVSLAARHAAGGCPVCFPPHTQGLSMELLPGLSGPSLGLLLPGCRALHLYLQNYSSGCHLARPYQPHRDTATLWETVSPCSQLYNRSHFIIVITACIDFHCYETGIDKAECLQSTFAHIHTQDTVCMLPQVFILLIYHNQNTHQHILSLHQEQHPKESCFSVFLFA